MEAFFRDFFDQIEQQGGMGPKHGSDPGNKSSEHYLERGSGETKETFRKRKRRQKIHQRQEMKEKTTESNLHLSKRENPVESNSGHKSKNIDPGIERKH